MTWRDPTEIDPVPADAARNNPIAKAQHDGRVRKMLIHLISYYRPDVARHPQVAKTSGRMATQIDSFNEVLSGLPDARTRWNFILSFFIPDLVEPMTKFLRKTKRGKSQRG